MPQAVAHVTDHVTAVFEVPVTVAEYCIVPPGFSSEVPKGETDIAKALSVMVAVALTDGSALAVAVTVTVVALVMGEGAV